VPADQADPLIRTHIPTELAAEREHLRASRASLRRMRERTLSLDAMGGNRVSTEYLKAALYRRAEQLLDDPETPLFFGRLDLRDPAERFYIGRRHVHDEAGDPMVIDWRAEISRAFYRASPADPMGVDLRRRFGFSAGTLTAYEDERLDATGPTAGPAAGLAGPTPEPLRTSRILTDEIERPRVGPMRDIVATIQPEQDDIVRADLRETICVQGAPGTGKTAVGLHRAAYLLYAFRDRLKRGGVLVVGPNRAFLSYIQQVLPALGEVDAKQMTLDELVAHAPLRGTDTVEAARIKGDARMAEVLRRAVWAGVRVPGESVVIARGSRRWRLAAHELAELVEGLRARDVRYGSGRAMLAQRIAHAVLVKMEAAGDSPDDRVQDVVARSRPVRDTVEAIWPAVDPVRLVLRLLSDGEHLAAAADGVLEPHEQEAIRWRRPPRGPGSARWSLADAVLVDEASDLVERIPSLGHVVLDEAQDLSPMQCRAVGRRCSTGSVTVLGDIAQGTTAWATEEWRTTLAHLGKPDARVEVLERGYRVPREIIGFASRLLPAIAPGVSPPTSIRQTPGSLQIRRSAGGELPGDVVGACRDALRREGSVGVVTADDRASRLAGWLASAGLEHHVLGGDAPDTRLAVVPATLAKGLEFDQVIVVEPAEIVAAEPRGLRRLYVVLTRAVSTLVVMHSRPLPADLRVSG
jgi:DNA helicase IV